MKKIIEINGVKLEVDLREATAIESYKVGDNVKVLKKQYQDSFRSCPGVIIGFDDFAQLPTILIAYLEVSYSSVKIEMVYLNSETKDIEICRSNENDIFIDQSSVVSQMQAEIEKKKMEVRELESKMAYFNDKFKMYFQKQ